MKVETFKLIYGNYILLPIISSHITQQTGNENIQTYQVEVVTSIRHQILMVNLQGNV